MDEKSEAVGQRAQTYERLRTWYLAHLRESQLVGDATNDLTPAALMNRDREALEQLIARSAPRQAEQTTPEQNNDKPERPFLGWLLTIVAANLIALGYIFSTDSNTQVSELNVRLALVFIFVSSSTLAALMSHSLFQKELMLQALKKREQAIADYALQAFWSLSDEYKFIAVSPVTKRLLNINSERLVGEFLSNAVPENEIERLEHFFASARSSKVMNKFETQMIKDDGANVDVELSAEFSLSDSAFYCVAINITDRKEVDRLKERLMSMISHDLRTPLSSLKMALSLLASAAYGELTDEGNRLLRVGEKNVGRLINLINQLLDMHKIDARQLKLNLSDALVSDIIQEAIEAVETYAQQKQIIVVTQIEEITIRADHDRLVQVVINLLSNAIKYSPNASEVIVSVKNLPGNFLTEFRVTDSGPGIAKEYRQAVFNPFFRIESKTGKGEEGTGLGLAICKAIIDAHGGKIDVKSREGKGASFFCHVPVAFKDSAN